MKCMDSMAFCFILGMSKDRLVAIKSGGQSLTELTTFCRELAKKGITDEFSDEDHEGTTLVTKDKKNFLISVNLVDSGDDYKIQHPFMVRERALPVPNPILLGISGMKSQIPSNALTLQTMTPAMRNVARYDTLYFIWGLFWPKNQLKIGYEQLIFKKFRSHRLSEFPVSSGNTHRQKEPSPSEEIETAIPTGLFAAQKAVSHLVATGDPLVKLLQLEDKSSSSTTKI